MHLTQLCELTCGCYLKNITFTCQHALKERLTERIYAKKLTFDLLNRCLNLKGIYQNLVTFVTSRRFSHFARLNAKTIPENALHVTTIKTGH